MKFTFFTRGRLAPFRQLAVLIFVMNALVVGGLFWLAFPLFAGHALRLAAAIIGILFLLLLQILFFHALKTKQPAPRKQDELSEIFFKAIMEDTVDAIYLKDRQHRLLMFNDWMAQDMGTTREAILGKSDTELFGTDFGASTGAEEDRIFESGKALINAIEQRNIETGLPHWTLTTKVPVMIDGEAKLILGITRRFGEIARVQEDLAYSAFHDSLTGLLNRPGISREMEESLRKREPLAVCFIDLDDFKLFNDSRGHDYGDAVLIAVANRLELVLRKDDRIGRYAGDEFVVLAHRVEVNDEARVVADKIFAAFEEPFEVNGNPCRVSASIGVSCCHNLDEVHEHSLAERLITSADQAMYQVKQHGKHGTAFAKME